MFKQLNDKIKYSELEAGIREYWKKNDVFRRSITSRAGRPTFSFFEGPPTANGRPGIHHVMSRTLKDLVCRLKTMQGYQVQRKAGWDTHGLPVEIEVEKMLGFKHKDDIVAYGVAKFNEECRKSVWKYKADWEEMTRLMGYWVDLDFPYITFENSYMESVWWALKQYFDRGFIYKGYKIQPYCPRCETPLSSHEVSLGYKDVKDPSVYVKMKLTGKGNTYFLVWTTTPWTLISNVALAVHPDVDYVEAEVKGQRLILAEARLSVLGEEAVVVDRFKGKSLAGKEYERLFTFHDVKEKGWYVVETDFVTTEDGSGIVHMAPAYGEDDYQAGRKYGLPTIHPVNKSGEFGPEVTPFAGKFVKDADPEIIADLKERGLLFKKEQHLHSYPHCWRCSSPLLYYARESWYIRTTSYADRMIALNKEVHWHPPEVGSGRFGNWLEENKDWALSRDRFWGTPLPIWVCGTCGKQKCVGSIAELREGANVPEPLDLHKPFVDSVTFTCSCGGTMQRTPELIDVWFDSGSMPFAQWHYPFENKEKFEASYPGDYISEGIDQTRGWFYTLHAIGSFLFDKPAYRNVLVNELILDKNGQKMSKTKGNTVDPFDLMRTYGADATRWYLVVNSPVWRPTLFDTEGIADVQRKFFSTLLNTYSFFSLYANIDGFTNAESRIPLSRRPEIDRWILSELNSLVSVVCDALEEYDVTRAARAINDFTVDRLSNWYVRRNRRRFWKSERGGDKIAAYQTLFECLVTLTKLIAPFTPHLSESIFRHLMEATGGDKDSVHLSAFPEADTAAIDRTLESKMERAMTIVSLVRSMREKTKLKVRQPLQRILVPVLSDREREEVLHMQDVILDEINVKKLEFVTEESDIVRRKAKPNFRTLGARYGKLVQKIAASVRELTSAQLRMLEGGGTVTVAADGGEYAIVLEDVEILHEEIKGWLVASDGPVTVALDTTITEELALEGLAREFVSRVQNLRKVSGFEVTDRIRIHHRSSDRLRRALESCGSYVREETLAVDLLAASATKNDLSFTSIDVNGETADVAVERI
ncbi:MAG: isoleucine--tRNA ligase [Ignavibacteria bacterium RIFCSPLOWO2_12_FULL_56_21]|nr:MAG: isoleucine--tRNA ligase [Ignavibacteria bacterium RIFCSPLOWO2_12_FULL_56_21]